MILEKVQKVDCTRAGKEGSMSPHFRLRQQSWKCEVFAINPNSLGSGYAYLAIYYIYIRFLGAVTQNPASLQALRNIRTQSTLTSQSSYSGSVSQELTRDFTGTFLSSHSPVINTRFLVCILKFLPGPFAWISFLQKAWAQTRSC